MKWLCMTGLVLIFVSIIASCTKNNGSPQENESVFTELSGPYLGQKTPGMTPELFAPGLISTGFREHTSPVFSPDGKEVYFHTAFSTYPRPILVMYYENNKWSYPQVAPFSGKYEEDNANFSPDGKKLVYSSYRPLSGEGEPKNDPDIWLIEKTKTGWSEPKNLGSPINSNHRETFPTLTKDGTLYFYFRPEDESIPSDIYKSKYLNGKYLKPEALDDNINSDYRDAFTAFPPDESYMIFASNRPGGFGRADLYISFREEDGSWSKAKNMGENINSVETEGSPHISPDGKYFFFTSDRTNFKRYSNKAFIYEELLKRNLTPGNGRGDVYWVDAKVINSLKPDYIKLRNEK